MKIRALTGACDLCNPTIAVPHWATPHERVHGRADGARLPRRQLAACCSLTTQRDLCCGCWMSWMPWLLEGGLEATPSIGAVCRGSVCRRLMKRTRHWPGPDHGWRSWSMKNGLRPCGSPDAARTLGLRFAMWCYYAAAFWQLRWRNSWWWRALDPHERVRWHLSRCSKRGFAAGPMDTFVLRRSPQMVALLRPIAAAATTAGASASLWIACQLCRVAHTRPRWRAEMRPSLSGPRQSDGSSAAGR